MKKVSIFIYLLPICIEIPTSSISFLYWNGKRFPTFTNASINTFLPPIRSKLSPTGKVENQRARPSSNNNHISFCQRRNSFIGLRFGTKLEIKEAGKSSTISSESWCFFSSKTYILPPRSTSSFAVVDFGVHERIRSPPPRDENGPGPRPLLLWPSSHVRSTALLHPSVAGSYSFYTLRCLSFSISGHRTLSGIKSTYTLPSGCLLQNPAGRTVGGGSLGWHLAKFGF